MTISLPPTAISSNLTHNSSSIDMVFSAMNSSTLFPLTNRSSIHHQVASTVLSMTITEKGAINLQDNVTIVLQLHSPVSELYTVTTVLLIP